MPTIGITHGFVAFQLTDGSLVNVSIIDTAGQEIYRALSKNFYKKADGILLVYDITRQESFDEIRNYYCKKIKEYCKEHVKIILLGNKTDLEEQRKIPPEVGANFAAENNFLFMETSCLTNKNVADGFETLIELTYRDVAQKVKNDSVTLEQNGNGNTNTDNKWNCCK